MRVGRGLTSERVAGGEYPGKERQTTTTTTIGAKREKKKSLHKKRREKRKKDSRPLLALVARQKKKTFNMSERVDGRTKRGVPCWSRRRWRRCWRRWRR